MGASTAVVLVPGFLGTEMHLTGPFGVDLGKVWLDVVKTSLGGWRLLDLNGSSIMPLGTNLTLGNPVEQVYGLAEKVISSLGVDYYGVGYDWRLSAMTSEQSVATQLESVSQGYSELVVVGHSFGGIVAARAIAAMHAMFRLKVKVLITLGTPWEGAYTAIEALCGRGSAFSIFSSIASLTTPGSLWRSRPQIMRVLNSMPALYDLLPSMKLLTSNVTENIPNPYQSVSWDLTNTDIRQDWLDRAYGRFERQIDLPETLKTICYCNGTLATEGPLQGGSSIRDARMPLGLLGDGTVPLESQLPPAWLKAEVRYTNSEHTFMCQSGEILKRIADEAKAL